MTDLRQAILAHLSEIERACEAATPGPWFYDEDECMFRMHGFFMPPKEQPTPSKQIFKAAKKGTPYAEYWPEQADADFMTLSRTALPALVSALRGEANAHNCITFKDYGQMCNLCGGTWPCESIVSMSHALGIEGKGE